MKLFELYGRRPLREDTTLRASIKLCESIIKALEDFDYEPDPAFAGVTGVSRDTGAGNIEAAAAKKKAQGAKLNHTWVTLIKKMQAMDATQAHTLKGHLQKVASAAKQRGFTLSPSPDSVLNV